MRFTSQINLVKLDSKGYKRELQRQMAENIREAARSWLTAVLVIIPTWSRASRATFEALANEVGFNITYGPILSRKDRLILGLETGKGGVISTPTSWHFFYETDLRYLAFNEFNHATFGNGGVFSRSGLTHPTPYHFQEAGLRDFLSFAETMIIPNPIDFIRAQKI